MRPKESGGLYFPPDFAKTVIRRGQLEARRSRALGAGGICISIFMIVGLGWLLTHSHRPANHSLVARAPAYQRSMQPSCPWGHWSFFSGDDQERSHGAGDEAVAHNEAENNPFR